MKLSKQERIGVLIIAVILILVLGVIFFIVPKVEEVGISQQQLDNKKTEYQAALDKAATKDALKTQVIDAYETGRDAANMFFEDMTTYEADAAVRAFLDYCKQQKVNVVVDSLSIGAPAVSTLSVSFPAEKPDISYDLKTYATQGLSKTEDELAAEARRDKLMAQLSSSQTVGSNTVTFTATFLEIEDYLKFVDTVNNYVVEENGKDMRKALKMNGISIEYDEVTEKYQELSNKMEADITKEAEKQLLKNFGDLAGVAENINKDSAGSTATQPENTEDEEAKELIYITDTIYEASITLTFYTIERMQDPTELLEAQDDAA